MKERLLKAKTRKTMKAMITAYHHAATNDDVALVGTYKSGQLDWIAKNGVYNLPVRDGDDEKVLKRVGELWLYAGAKGIRHVFAAEFIEKTTRENWLARYPSYAEVGNAKAKSQKPKAQHVTYWVFRVSPLVESVITNPLVMARTDDFGRCTMKMKAAIGCFHADGEFAPLSAYLPSDLASVPHRNLRVCEAALQMEFSLCDEPQICHPVELNEFIDEQKCELEKSTKRIRLHKDQQITSESISCDESPIPQINSITMLGEHTVYEGDCIKVLRSPEIPEMDLIVADPPYWKVIGEKWDYQWRTENDYIEWSRKWITAVYNKLRIGGTFYLFGYFRMLALLLPILKEIGFSLRQQIIVDKGMKAIAGRATKNYKMFPCVTESILFLTKNNIDFSRNLLKSRQNALGLSAKEINERLGVKSNGGGMWSIYTGENICEQFPTKELWAKLQEILKFNYPYEKIVQTFNPLMGYKDVWTDVDFYSEKRYHSTQKPIKLIERLIRVSSNQGDKILDPFGGSGATLISAAYLGRKSYTIELDKKYIQAIKDRYSDEFVSRLTL